MDGLIYQADYLTELAETELLQEIDFSPWLTPLQRRVQHYGYVYDYKRRTVTPEMFLGGLPKWLIPVAERLHAEGWMPMIPDQVIINEYEAGQGIAPHVDCEPCFGDTIVSITLGTGCLMDFAHLASGETHLQWLAPRSLLVMQGSARYDWTHGITPRKTDMVNGQKISRGRRVSLTFRKVILTP